MQLTAIKNVFTKASSRVALKATKYAPEILVSTGIVAGVGAAVLGARATLKASAIVEKFEEGRETVRAAEDHYESPNDKARDLAYLYTTTAIEFTKLYGPAISLGIASIGCILGAHGIMRRRNAALVAAYSVLERSFNQYRDRVSERLGEMQEKDIFHGITEEKVESPEGKSEVVTTLDPGVYSPYARFFDELSPNFERNPEFNLIFLKAQQNYANDMLKARGHLFLNEVYDMLGIPRSSAGQVVGWVLGKGDSFVDFGMYDPTNERKRNFVNGLENAILLDFNVAGVVYDLI